MLVLKNPERFAHEGLGECERSLRRWKLAEVGRGVCSPDSSYSREFSTVRWRWLK
jgi:hypothetical protein